MSRAASVSNILVIDDQEIVHERLRTICEQLNLSCRSAYSGDDAIAAIRSDGTVGLVVVDVNLSQPLDGISVAERIMAIADVPVVFLTASDDADTMGAIGNVTHYGVILKSSKSPVIAESIRMAARLARFHRSRVERATQYKAQVESIRDIMVVHDPDGYITYANERCAEAVGRSTRELEGESVNAVFGNGYLVRSQILAREGGATEGRSFDLTRTIVTADGHEMILAIRSSAVFHDRRYAGEMVVARDITEIQTARDHLETINQLLGSIRQVHKVVIRSQDPGSLIQDTCSVLVDNGAYPSAWILLDPSELDPRVRAGAAGFVASSGEELLQILGASPTTVLAACRGESSDVTVYENPAQENPGCPLNLLYHGYASLTTRLHYGGTEFGVLNVAIPGSLVHEPDTRQVFRELAADLSFALHSMVQRHRRRQAERQAFLQQRRLQSFFEHSPMSIVTTDTAGRILTTNRFFCEWVGWAPEELEGTDLRRLLARRDPILDRLCDGAGFTGETARRLSVPLRKRNGKAVWGQGVAVPVVGAEDDDPVLIVVLADTTGRRVAEQRLSRAHQEIQRSESRYRSLFEDSADLVFVSAEDGTLVDINGAGAHMLGYEHPSEVIGRNAAEFYYVASDRNYFLEEIARNGYVKNLEVVLKRADGEPVFGSESATRVRDSDDDQPLYQGVIHDITERIKSEKESIQRSMELSKANEELRQAHEELVKKEKLASIGQLSAGVAHEINNPLGFVRSNLSVLRRYVDRYVPFFAAYRDLPSPRPESLEAIWDANRIEVSLEDVQDLFDETEEGIKRIVAIVSNLKDFSRAGSNEIVDNYDINRGVESSLVIGRNEYKYVAEVAVNAGDVPLIACNANEINQVLLTLIVNAAQAIRSAGTADGRIDISTWSDTETVYCRVRDNGPGIPPAQHRLVFEPFYTTKKAGEGTGLGLSIAYDIIVNRHGGAIRLESAAGAGATFTLEIPRRRPPDERNVPSSAG